MYCNLGAESHNLRCKSPLTERRQVPLNYKLRPLIFTLAVIAGSSCSWAGPAQPGGASEAPLHAVVPLGVDSLRLENSNRYLNLVASASSPELEGVRRIGDQTSGALINDAGQPIQFYPKEISFRVSALTSDTAFEDDSATLPCPADANDYLLNIRFRLKVFSGLRYFYVSPESVELIGMPADVAYDERIYRATFRLPTIPVNHRILLEVLDPQGTRISRFHFELQ